MAEFVARRLAASLKAADKSDTDVWEDPAFAPKAIVEALVAETPRFGNDVPIADVRKVVDFLPWKPADMLSGASERFVAEGSARPVFFMERGR